jgi:hypothetical protein
MNELVDPTCGDCKAFYMEAKDENGVIRGLCRRRPELGEVPAHMTYCYLFQVRTSRIGQVKPIEPKAPPRRGGASRSTTFQHDENEPKRATLNNPITGDTSGEITMDRDGLKQVLRELLEEETMYGYSSMGARWKGGTVTLKPGREETQTKEIPLDTLFHKIVMVRDRLRVLEAKINANDKLDEQDKVELQSYITKCYGSLTTFNVLFRDKSEYFSSK